MDGRDPESLTCSRPAAHIPVMNAVNFDTHRIVKRLQDVGFDERQAETVTDVFREVRQTDLSQLATKTDVAAMATKRDLADLGREIRHEMQALEQRMTIKLGSLVIVAVGAVATLVKLL